MKPRSLLHLPSILLALAFASTVLRADDWPQWLGPQRDAVWWESGIIEAFPASGPVVRWRATLRAGKADSP